MKPSSGITASVCNLRPKSRGHLELISNRVEDPPKIFANYLSATKDLKVMIDGIKRTREIFRTDVMKDLSAKEILPGEECISDKDLEKFIKNEALSVYHPVGTCKMGTGPECVVDTNLMVKGLQGLRVADASIFPEIISGNTNATCNVIGAKCADLILEKG
jgi:choline dehydrogenase